MKNKTLFSDFTKQYALSKTLRFELKPLGKTADHIKDKGLLIKDEQRAEDYKVVKKLIDEVHKDFIEQTLSQGQLSNEGLQLFYDAYVSPERDIKLLTVAAEKLRKEVAAMLKNNPTTDPDLFTKTLPHFLRGQGRTDEVEFLKLFNGFTTYFKGFHENRANMYKAEEQATAIAYRLINENLPKFVSNLVAYGKLTRQHGLDMSKVEENMVENLYGETLDSFFTLGSFNLCLTQSGIERYNVVLGGKTENDGTKLQGINEKVNLYRQVAEEKADKKAPFLAPLFKQILSDREQTSYLPEQFENSNEAVAAIKEFYANDVAGYESDKATVPLMDAIESLLNRTLADMDDLNGVWVQNNAISEISQQLLGSWQVLPDALMAHVEGHFKTKKDIEKQQKRSYVSIAELETALLAYLPTNETMDRPLRDALLAQQHPIASYFQKGMRNIETGPKTHERLNVFRFLEQRHLAAQPLLAKDWTANGLIQATAAEKAILKDYLDSYLHVLHFIKPFHVAPPKKEGGEVPEKDTSFYNAFDALYRHLDGTSVPLYNKVRSYMTRKPYSVEKFKLNFENGGNFLDGFVESVTERSNNGTQYGGYLFHRKNAFGAFDYFIGVSSNSRLFSFVDADKVIDIDRSEYERLNYYQMKSTSVYGSSYPGIYKAEKVEFIAAIMDCLEENNAIDLINEIRGKLDEETTPGSIITKIQQFDQKHTTDYLVKISNAPTTSSIEQRIIGNIMQSLSRYVARVPKISTYLEKTYESLAEIQAVVDEVAAEKSFYYAPVSRTEFDDALNSDMKKLYLFQILNKDLRYSANRDESKRGRDNLHTMYFKQLMSGTQDVFDIGKGEIFFRPASIKNNLTVHPKGIALDKKNPLKKGETSLFSYDIIKDKRFTEDKFQFHLSVLINYKEGNPKAGAFNTKVQEVLKAHPGVNIIGIDRGERHLAYYTVIDPQGRIKDQGSFNEVTNTHKGVDHTFDYHDKLDGMEKSRDAARKDWQSIGNIKEMKEGYLSQVVHKIARLMVEHNAIVVFEDLNFGFKRGRMKVEKQVYQKLEKMLMDKLNYLMFKDEEHTAPGGLLNAYQLAAPFESFKAMGKQTGFIFYIPAANTSKIDPATGFINMLYSKYENEKKAKEFVAKFEGIGYNAVKKWFEFVADTNAFTGDKATKVSNSRWTICTQGDRWQYTPSDKTNKPVNVTQELEKLLGDNGIAYGGGTDLRAAIAAVSNAKFFERLLWLLRLTLQMRYSDDKGADYLLSPVADATGRFFDSRQAEDGEPKDPDANGAFHIALKGQLLLHKMKRGDKDLRITGAEWADFVTERQVG